MQIYTGRLPLGPVRVRASKTADVEIENDRRRRVVNFLTGVKSVERRCLTTDRGMRGWKKKKGPKKKSAEVIRGDNPNGVTNGRGEREKENS